MTTTIKQVQVPVEPSLKDLLDYFRKDLLQNLNCHHIGTVQSFDEDAQTARATVNYVQTYFQYSAGLGTYTPVTRSYPVLLDCPVLCLGGGLGSLTFPIASGDECLILFNDRDMSNWINGATGAQVATPRLHSFSDALLIVGFRSLANALEDYDTSNVVLQYGSTKVTVGESKIGIANAVTTLGAQLSDLTQALETFMIACESSTDATLVAAAAAAAPVISAVETALGGLLT